MTNPAFWSSAALLGALWLATVLTFWRGSFDRGEWRLGAPQPSGWDWFLYSSTNTFCAVAFIVLFSSFVGVAIGSMVRPRSANVAKGLELMTTLPVLTLGLLWLNAKPVAPLATVTLVVAVHRSLQVAVLTQRALAWRWTTLGARVPQQLLRLRELQRLLCVSGSHSAVIFFFDEAALRLLGFLPDHDGTWVGAWCAAARAVDVPPLQLAVALVLALALPLALWHLGTEADERDSQPSNPLPLSLDRRI